MEPVDAWSILSDASKPLALLPALLHVHVTPGGPLGGTATAVRTGGQGLASGSPERRGRRAVSTHGGAPWRDRRRRGRHPRAGMGPDKVAQQNR